VPYVRRFVPRFVRETPFGVAAAVALPEPGDAADEAPAALHPEEAAYARTLPPARRASYVGGRLALRAALEALGGGAAGAILSTPRGAPLMPAGFVGSISHKLALAVALVARIEAGAPPTSVGIDLELPRPLRFDIGERVLTPDERAALAGLAAPARAAEVLRRFAIKEAIYKALDPFVQRFVSFQEVALAVGPEGELEARLGLARGEGPFAVALHDASDAATILVAAQVRRA
jgi:4'-phosphopantetheinyl transferase EntD